MDIKQKIKGINPATIVQNSKYLFSALENKISNIADTSNKIALKLLTTTNLDDVKEEGIWVFDKSLNNYVFSVNEGAVSMNLYQISLGQAEWTLSYVEVSHIKGDGDIYDNTVIKQKVSLQTDNSQSIVLERAFNTHIGIWTTFSIVNNNTYESENNEMFTIGFWNRMYPIVRIYKTNINIDPDNADDFEVTLPNLPFPIVSVVEAKVFKNGEMTTINRYTKDLFLVGVAGHRDNSITLKAKTTTSGGADGEDETTTVDIGTFDLIVDVVINPLA